MKYIFMLIFLVIGLLLGELVLNPPSETYDKNLLIATIIFFFLGSETVVFSFTDCSIMLSHIVTPFLLGVLMRRYINNHIYIRKKY